jgi:hypothetical protein
MTCAVFFSAFRQSGRVPQTVSSYQGSPEEAQNSWNGTRLSRVVLHRLIKLEQE